MDKMKLEICNDCLHHKGNAHNITCSLTGHKPMYDFSCPDFAANDNYTNRTIGKKYAEKEELDNKGQIWLWGGCCIGVPLFVIGTMISISAEKYANIYLLFIVTIAIIALSIYMFERCRMKTHTIDISIAKLEARGRQGVEVQSKVADAKSNDDVVTTDRIIGFLRDLGYNPSCESTDNGVKWIRILYGENNIFIAYDNTLLQAYCPFALDESAENGAFVYNFMLAANAVMINKRFVQITGNTGGCQFVVSGYVKTLDELRQYLPNYMSIINESIVAHRYHLEAFEREDQEAAKAEYSPQNNGIVN